MKSNRRKYPRYDARVIKNLKTAINLGNDHWFNSWILNISEGGIKLISDLPDIDLKENQTIQIRLFDRTTSFDKKINGKLKWYSYLTEEMKIIETGIEFSLQNDPDKKTARELVKYLSA